MEQKGVNGVQTFTGEETREDADNKNIHPTYLKIIEPSDTGPINQMNITDPDYI